MVQLRACLSASNMLLGCADDDKYPISTSSSSSFSFSLSDLWLFIDKEENNAYAAADQTKDGHVA
jgi:hypothetical protein